MVLKPHNSTPNSKCIIQSMIMFFAFHSTSVFVIFHGRFDKGIDANSRHPSLWYFVKQADFLTLWTDTGPDKHARQILTPREKVSGRFCGDLMGEYLWGEHVSSEISFNRDFRLVRPTGAGILKPRSCGHGSEQCFYKLS